jgi:hypothetical protein
MKDELTRREFLIGGTTAAPASDIAAGSVRGVPAQTSIQRYEAELPDTLDLAGRAH